MGNCCRFVNAKNALGLGRDKNNGPFSQICTSHFRLACFRDLPGILAQVTRLLNNRLLFVRLIEAQEGTREIKKLNHIMKTKDARIENLESK